MRRLMDSLYRQQLHKCVNIILVSDYGEFVLSFAILLTSISNKSVLTVPVSQNYISCKTSVCIHFSRFITYTVINIIHWYI